MFGKQLQEYGPEDSQIGHTKIENISESDDTTFKQMYRLNITNFGYVKEQTEKTKYATKYYCIESKFGKSVVSLQLEPYILITVKDGS